LKTQVKRLKRLVTYLLNEWNKEQWSDTLESLDSEDQSLWKMTKRVRRVPSPSLPLQVPGGVALLDSGKAEALADSLAAQFQPVDDRSEPTVIEMVNEAMGAYKYFPATEPKITSPSEFLQVIRGLNLGRVWARSAFRTGS
jgi:hypothetical protein